MQPPGYNSAPYHLHPSNPTPNITFQPSSTSASAPPFSNSYLPPDHHPSSSYPPTYPPYPLNPDAIPPTAASYNPNPNPNLQQFTPNSLSSLDQCGQPYQPPAQQHSYYPQFDQRHTGPTYASPNPNPSYSSTYIGSSVPIPPLYENRCESDNSKFDQFGETYGRSRSDVGPEMYGNRSDSGLSRLGSVSGLGGDGYGYSDGVYAYQGSKKEPYGARGTGTKSSTWSGFDDFGRPISSPTGKDSFLAPTKVVRAVPKADTQQDMKSGIQKFRVKLLAESGGQSTIDVLCQIGLDGIRMLDPNTSRTLRIYPLENITRSEVLDSTIFAFWAKSSVDIEPRRIRLKSNSYTSNTILDIVTAATIQFKEMGGRSKPSELLKPVEQPSEKKKGLGDWMNLIKPGNEEKDHWHHCRNCGDIFCDKCTHGRIALTAEENAQPVRVCDRCLAEVTQRLNIAKEATSRSAGSLQSHEDLAKKLQEEMERNRKVSSGFRSDGSGRRMKEVACPTCTVHLQVQVPSSGSETIECGVCQHPFIVSAH